MIGLYRAGTSPLHRCPAGVKLAGLLVVAPALLILRSVPAVLIGAAVVVALYATARFGPRVLWEQVRPLRWFVVVLAPVQWWLLGPVGAFITIGTLVVAVAAAGVVTLTTRTEDLLDVIERTLRPLPRVDAERIALVLILTIRAIPVLAQFASEVQQARRARGLERSVRAFAVPLVLRTIGHADRLGDALIARGIDD
jgi:biotin transport system permease protein